MCVQVSSPKCRTKSQPEDSQNNLLKYRQGHIIRYNTKQAEITLTEKLTEDVKSGNAECLLPLSSQSHVFPLATQKRNA